LEFCRQKTSGELSCSLARSVQLNELPTIYPSAGSSLHPCMEIWLSTPARRHFKASATEKSRSWSQLMLPPAESTSQALPTSSTTPALKTTKLTCTGSVARVAREPAALP